VRQPVTAPHLDLAHAVRSELARHADPVRAVGQQRYMKSALPYRGLTTPQLRSVLRPVLDDEGHRMSSPSEWEATIRVLWDEAAYREEWYAAIVLARHRAYRRWVGSESMPLWRHLIVTGGWWDVVDDVATHLVRDVRLGAPEVEGLRLREWAESDDLWLRRSAIVCQVGLRTGVDRGLLVDRAQPCGPRLLHPQGHRLGAARPRSGRARLGAHIRRPARRPAVRTLPPRGDAPPGARMT